eukprot:536483_1
MAFIEIDGYVHHIIEKALPDRIIPSSINHLISVYYDPLWRLELPPQTEHRYPNLVYYFCQKDEKEYVILAPFVEDSKHCYKYDIKQNKWIKFAKYPVQAKCHSLAVDQDNDLLYISHGHNRIFAIYNLVKNKWNTISKTTSHASTHNVQQYIANATSLVLPNHEYHLLCNILTHSGHVKWNKEQNKFVSASSTGIRNNCYLFESCLVFVTGRNMLMALGGYLSDGNHKGNTDCIWYTDYVGDDPCAEYEWKEYQMKLPNKMNRISCVVAFDFILIISSDELWILDLDESKECKQWVKPIGENSLFKYPKRCKLILTKRNYLHFINCYEEKQCHCKVHLSRFIPPKIYRKYQTQ